MTPNTLRVSVCLGTEISAALAELNNTLPPAERVKIAQVFFEKEPLHT